MKEVFEKIIDELKHESIIVDDDAGNRAVEIIEQIAEEYNNGWILCSMKMPKVENLREISIDNCTAYLVQRRCGLMDVAHYIKIYGESYFEANALKLSDVVAWQQLPAPYQPKGE